MCVVFEREREREWRQRRKREREKKTVSSLQDSWEVILLALKLKNGKRYN